MAIGVSPERLELSLKRNEPGKQSLFIQNLGERDQRVEIRAAGFEKLIEINPDEANLPPQKIVPVEIKIQGKKDFETELEIQTLTEGNDLAIQSGIKIPLKVEVENSLNYYYLIFGIFVVTAAIIVLSRLKRKKI